jgi:hypothetical protein
MDPKTFVEKMFKCPYPETVERPEKRRKISSRPEDLFRSTIRETPQLETSPLPPHFNSKKTPKTSKKKSKKTSKKTPKKTPKKKSKKTSKKTPKKSSKTSKKKSKKTSKKKSKKTPKKNKLYLNEYPSI